MIKVYKAAGYLIRLSNLTEAQVEDANDRFTYAFYDEKACSKCEQLEDRHSEMCDNCTSFKGFRRLSKVVEKRTRDDDTVEMFSLPFGATKQVRSWLKDNDIAYKVVDSHPESKAFRRKIRFTGTAHKWQDEAIQIALEKKKGIVKAPPRSGKTVFATKLICTLGVKTLIIASQIDWLRQFRETFIGSETQHGFTTCKPSQIKICKTYEDFRDTDVCLTTFSKFMSPSGKKLLRRISEMYSVLVVDECHYTPALETSRILASFNTRYRLGLSGTVERKNASEIQVAHDLLGEIIYSANVERLRPKISLLHTNVKIDLNGSGQRAFTGFVGRLEKHSKRVNLIAKKVVEMVEQGHMVFLPVTRVNSIQLYVNAINELAEDRIAYPFFGGLRKDVRERTVEMARTYEAKVLVGNIRLLSTGLNVPRASCIIDRVTVSSNIPSCDQRISRILTPMKGKPAPVVVFVLDDSDIMRSCLRNEWWNCIKPRHNPIISREDYSALTSWISKRSTSRDIDISEPI